MSRAIAEGLGGSRHGLQFPELQSALFYGYDVSFGDGHDARVILIFVGGAVLLYVF